MTDLKHWLTWEDGGMAGFDCGKKEGGVLTAHEARQCPVCGKYLRLIWDVRIEELSTERQ